MKGEKMKKNNLWLGIMAMMLVFGMTVLGTCSSAPDIELPEPDAKSAVVYFFGYKSDGANLWDGEKPIGDFSEGVFLANLAWKTTPGEHYFIANTFNWVVIRANLKANQRYYLKLDVIPNPIPFSKNIIVFRDLEPADGEKWIKRAKTFAFSDEWRAKYAQGDRLKDVREQLQKAKKDKSALQFEIK